MIYKRVSYQICGNSMVSEISTIHVDVKVKSNATVNTVMAI